MMRRGITIADYVDAMADRSYGSETIDIYRRRAEAAEDRVAQIYVECGKDWRSDQQLTQRWPQRYPAAPLVLEVR
jgi:ATP-dependent protease HslVU (ClpYQ) peptidase subunit